MTRVRLSEDRGSTIPLILGFFLVALLLVAAAVMASDSYAKQRNLQSVCDGAALAASNAIDSGRARVEVLRSALPLEDVQAAVDDYLSTDPQRADVRAAAGLAPDGATVTVDCRTHVSVAFGPVFGRGGGVDERATSTARGTLSD